MPRRFPVACVSALALAILGRVALADWLPDGTAVIAAPCEEVPSAVVADDRGGAYVVWTDNHTCNHSDVFLQRLTAAGDVAPGWPALGLPVFVTTAGQGGGVAVSDDQSGVIVSWLDGRSGLHLMAQRFAPDGAKLWGPADVRVSDVDGDINGAQILRDGAGGMFVAWADARRGLDDGPPHFHPVFDLYAQHLDASGTRLWGASGLAVSTNPGDFSRLTLVTDGGAGVLVTWIDASGPAYLQHLDASGTALLPANGVPVSGPFLGIATSDGAGGILSAITYGPDTQEDLYVQRIDASGALELPPGGVVVASAAHGQRVNDVVSDGAGGAYIAWYDLRNGLDWDAYVQRVTSAGTKALGWPANGLAVATASGFQVYPRLVADGSGGCVVVWYDARNVASGYDIYAQRLTAQGEIAPGWTAGGARLCGAIENQTHPLLAPDGTGGAIVTWIDQRGYWDVYAQRVSGAGVVGETGGIVGVAPSAPASLALGRAYPNPLIGRGRVFVPISVESTSPAELSLVDLSGRCVLRQPVVPQDQTATITLDLPAGLRSGVYQVRLRQSGRTVSKAITIFR